MLLILEENLREKLACNCLKAVHGIDEEFVSIHICFTSFHTDMMEIRRLIADLERLYDDAYNQLISNLNVGRCHNRTVAASACPDR